MAQQFIYSRWWENQTECTLYAASAGVMQTDIDYIIHQTETVVDFEFLEEDEDNPDLAATLYLRLPSGFNALIRTGKYVSENTVQTSNYILHAIIAEDGDLSAPLLYAVNNCFKTSLTTKEQRSLSKHPKLPEIPFPRPQFKLNQAEIEKFFSQGRLKTLACLIQAAIDSYENQKIIILNDKLSNIKYWFYGLHCCLPYSIRKKLTYSTYSYACSDKFKLICGAPNNAIDSEAAIESGQFLIDNTGGKTCEDIESAKYARFVVEQFIQDSVGMQYIPTNIDNFMNEYSLNLPTAAGIWKLMKGDFNWFDSPYDIQVFFGKVNNCIPSELENLSESLWNFLESGNYKIKLGVQLLPLVSMVFKNGSRELKERIILFINKNRMIFDISHTQSLKSFYYDLVDKLSFLYEYILDAIIIENRLEEYCEIFEYEFREITVLLCQIADRYEELSQYINTSAIEKVATLLLQHLLNALPSGQTEEMILEFCHKASALNEAFIRNVIVASLWSHLQDKTVDECLLDEKLIFSIIEELIEHPLLSANLVRIYARKGKYAESTLKRYLYLCRNYPEATEIIDRNLEENEAFDDFLRDLSAYRFASLEITSEDELLDYFHNYYISGKDRDHTFMQKLDNYIISLNPVHQIDVAHEFLLTVNQNCSEAQIKEISSYLIPYINSQSICDIFDYYANHKTACSQVADIFSACHSTMSAELKTVLLIVALQNAESENSWNASLDALITLNKLLSTSDILAIDKEGKEVVHRLYASIFANQRIAAKGDGQIEELFFDIYSSLMSRDDFSENYLEYLHLRRLSSVISEETVVEDTVAFFSVTLPILLQYTYTREESVIESATIHAISSVPYSIRREVYRGLLSKCNKEESISHIKTILTELYYADLSLLQKISAPNPKKLFDD